MSKYFDGELLSGYDKSPETTIFGEKSFIDMGIQLIEAQEKYIYDEISKTISVAFPQVVIDKERLEKWINFCLKLENIEETDLIDIATQKKICDLKSQLSLTEKQCILMAQHIRQDLKCDDTEDEIYKYFKEKAIEELTNEKNS